MVVNVGDNRWATSNFIVAPTIAEGASYTTIAAALTAASSGNTIFIKPGTYTENLTLKAGVNLTAFECDSSINGTGNVIISGTCTLTAAGTVTISGIQLQTNSAALLAVTGSEASIVNLNNCYLNCTNNTGITFSSSLSSARINCRNCQGNIGTTGIALISHSSAGTFDFSYSVISNSGGSTTASTVSAGSWGGRYSSINLPITSSGTASVAGSYNTYSGEATNSTALTIGGSGNARFDKCRIISGSAVAITITSEATLNDCIIESTNTNATSGAGTLIYGGLTFDDTGNNLGTTTKNAHIVRPGITRSTSQPAFLAQPSSGAVDQTGDGTAYTVVLGTEIFDQNGDFDGTSTFTAPYTAQYQLSAVFAISTIAAGHTTGVFAFTTSNRAASSTFSPAAVQTAGNVVRISQSLLMDMDAADTAVLTITVSGGTKTVDIITSTYFSGILSC